MLSEDADVTALMHYGVVVIVMYDIDITKKGNSESDLDIQKFGLKHEDILRNNQYTNKFRQGDITDEKLEIKNTDSWMNLYFDILIDDKTNFDRLDNKIYFLIPCPPGYDRNRRQPILSGWQPETDISFLKCLD